MRICLLAPPWIPVPPPYYGGAEEVLDTLAQGLERAGCRVLLVTTGDATCPVLRSWTFDEAVGTDLATGVVAAELRQVVHGYEVAQAWRADVVHDHTLIGPIYGRHHTDLSIVTTNHGTFQAADGEPIYGAIAEEVPVVAISAHQAATASATPVSAVIPHGVDLARYPLGDGDGGYAALLGRMHPDKGVDTACRVARRAGVPLRIAAKMSESRERDYFDAAVRPLLGGDVEYVGELGFNDKCDVLGGATTLLNPIAWDEPFGMVMIESLACGTPVVACPRGAAAEIVDDHVTGFLRDGEANLADAVAAARDLDRRACRRAADERFSAERMVADHIELYVKTMERSAAR